MKINFRYVLYASILVLTAYSVYSTYKINLLSNSLVSTKAKCEISNDSLRLERKKSEQISNNVKACELYSKGLNESLMKALLEIKRVQGEK